MKTFITEEFMLNSKTAVRLYEKYAKDCPIIDYHCHLNPKDIAEDKQYRNLTEIWLGGDHYKWRLMRACGVDEKYITGDADDREKYLKFAEILPRCIGNPVYHWVHLELKRYFDIDKVLCPETADKIWKKCNKILTGGEFTARTILKKFNVKAVCTTDDPADDLNCHKQISQLKNFNTRVYPTYRPDKAVNIDKDGFCEYIAKLGAVAGREITSLDDLKSTLKARAEFFKTMGCVVSDHGIDTIKYVDCPDKDADKIFMKAMHGKELSKDEIHGYRTNMLVFFGMMYADLKWVMQLHIGVIRNPNSRMFRKLGPDTGYDVIGDFNYAPALCRLFDDLEKTDLLPKTVLYSINSDKNDVLATIAGSFCKAVPGKVQLGTSWWFNDHLKGMTDQLVVYAQTSPLGNFIGMLTDSRSFLSFTRHEYFRRILCNLVAEWMDKGQIPSEMKYAGTIVRDICFNNVNNYFDFGIKH